jgi:acyl-CoA thioesterase-1
LRFVNNNKGQGDKGTKGQRDKGLKKGDSSCLMKVSKGGFMKKPGVFAWLPVFCVFFVILAGCSNGSTNYPDGTVVCLGDSLTEGYGAVTQGVVDKSQSYPAYLQNKVNIPVINAGVSGNTSAQGLARVDTEVLSKNPKIVVIILGANDLGRGIPVTTTKDNLQNIINKVNNGNRKIYLAKFYTEAVARALANTYGFIDFIDLTEIVSQYDNLFNALASENDVTLIEDIWSGVWGINMSDAVHPNAKGYEMMANNIFNVLLPYLQANGLIK